MDDVLDASGSLSVVSPGGTSGALATFFGSPFYLLKTQFQAQDKSKDMATGYQVGMKADELFMILG